MPKCNNPECCSSTGIHEGSTFGSGRIDEHGFWEFPCRICAAEHDANREETIRNVREQILKSGRTIEEAEKYLREAIWINEPAWPYAETNIAEETKEIQQQLNKRDQDWEEFDKIFQELSD